VIFNVEGTLVDSTALTLRCCWQETLQSFGFEFPSPHCNAFRAKHDMLQALLPGRPISHAVSRVMRHKAGVTCRTWWRFPKYGGCLHA
jgi:beta-phosphoglucomutase-like phosphatase (HAD superfamily)